jgi:hypothetical protein
MYSKDDLERTYRAFLGWSPPAQQIADALQLIQPLPDRCEECKAHVILALKAVRFARDFKKDPLTHPRAAVRDQLLEAAKILKRAAANDFLARQFDADLDELRKAYKKLAAGIPVSAGSPRRDDVKQTAASMAHNLLAGFGSTPPSLTQGSTWDQLAVVLFGGGIDSLFSYMRYHQEAPKLFPSA